MPKPCEYATAALILDVEKMARQGVKKMKVSAKGTGAGIAIRKKTIEKGPRKKTNDEIQEMIESKIVPDLYFWPFQGAIEVNGVVGSPSDRVFRMLLFLEYCAGKCAREEIQGKCWSKGGSDGALRAAILEANKFLGDMGLTQTVNRVGEDVVWE